MKIERAAPKASEAGDAGDEAVGQDGRRARLADLQRLEALLNVVEGKLEEVQRELAGRDTAPVSRSIFYANFYTFSALAGKAKPHVLRADADQAWEAYQEALTCAPRRTLDEVYGGKAPAKIAAPVAARPLSEPTPVGEPTPAQFYTVQVQTTPAVAEAVTGA